MEYRLDKDRLLDILGEWNRFLKRKVRLIACGGTAMTLIGVINKRCRFHGSQSERV